MVIDNAVRACCENGVGEQTWFHGHLGLESRPEFAQVGTPTTAAILITQARDSALILTEDQLASIGPEVLRYGGRRLN